MSNHNHKCSCEHENVKFCKHCNTVYCKDCNQEWTTKYTWYLNSGGYSYPTNGLIQSSGYIQNFHATNDNQLNDGHTHTVSTTPSHTHGD